MLSLERQPGILFISVTYLSIIPNLGIGFAVSRKPMQAIPAS
jgi:hypothetical protein